MKIKKIVIFFLFGTFNLSTIFASYTVEDLIKAIDKSNCGEVEKILNKDASLIFEVHKPCIFCRIYSRYTKRSNNSPIKKSDDQILTLIKETIKSKDEYKYSLRYFKKSGCLCFQSEKYISFSDVDNYYESSSDEFEDVTLKVISDEKKSLLNSLIEEEKMYSKKLIEVKDDIKKSKKLKKELKKSQKKTKKKVKKLRKKWWKCNCC